MSKPVTAALLNFKPGTGSYIIGGLFLFICIALAAQYFGAGHGDVESMIDQSADHQEFWVRNPHLGYLDSYRGTSLFLARERENGRASILDLAVVSNAEARLQPCDEQIGAAASLAFPGAAEAVCFSHIKPNQSSPLYRTAVSFRAKGKAGQVANYYQKLFRGLGKKTTVVQDSSQAIVLQAEDGNQNTVARVAIHGSSDIAYVFLAVIAAP
jgi:hypothetical protein